MTDSPIHILLVEDETLIREALASLLALEDDLEVVARAGSVAEAKAVLRSTEVDVALLDLQLPDGDGIDLAEVDTGLLQRGVEGRQEGLQVGA